MKRVLFDTDVLLDVLLVRQPFYLHSMVAMDAAGLRAVEGFLAGHAVTNLFYILRKQVGADLARSQIADLLTELKIAPITEAVIHSALSSSFTDFEDAVTAAAAQAVGVDELVTRNTADYTGSPVPAVLPVDFKVA